MNFQNNNTSMFKSSSKTRNSGIGMWAVKLERSSAGLGECCTIQTDNPAEEFYLPPCCVETFFHDMAQTSLNGHIVGNRYPWPLTKKPVTA
jgi:hypothetical protein